MEPLDDNPAHWIRLLAGQLAQRAAADLRGRGVTAAEWALLRVLYEAGAVAPSVLAARAGLSRGAVTKLVDRLRAKRLLVRAAGAGSDRRYQTIALTGEGARLVPELAALVARGEAAVFAPLPPARRAMLLAALQAVGRGTGLARRSDDAKVAVDRGGRQA